MANAADDVGLPETMCYWLRHQPAAASLALDAQGWTGVQAVLAARKQAGSTEDWSGRVP